MICSLHKHQVEQKYITQAMGNFQNNSRYWNPLPIKVQTIETSKYIKDPLPIKVQTIETSKYINIIFCT